MWPFETSLGDLERAVMDVLWDADGRLSVREVHDALTSDRDLAYTTVMTVLDRLSKKKIVTRVREGRAWQYRPAASREEMTAATMRTTFEALDTDNRKSAMLHFLDGASQHEIAEIQAALAEVTRQNES